MVNVFYTDITNYQYNERDLIGLYPCRKEYVNSITDIVRKCQSLLVWRLLNYALSQKIGTSELSYSLADGKWFDKSGKVKFSLSHSNNIVAVAISTDYNVGVDVEMCSSKILKIKSKFNIEDCTESQLIDRLTLLWTEKESLFKADSLGKVNSVKINDEKGNNYFLSFCSESINFEIKEVKLHDIISSKGE